MSFFAELRRRNAFRVAAGYLVAAWLIVQVVNNVAAPLALPGWTPALVIVLLAVGFPVALVLAWAREMPSEGGAAPVRPVGAMDIALIALLVAVLGVSAYQIGRPNRTPVQAAVADAAPAASVPDAAPADPSADSLSVAVLPFADMSPQGDQEYFADGLSEELMNQLAQVEGLRVTGRTSSFVYKDHNEDLRTIGETLGVAHILEGSVRKAGDRVRITAQLISAADGYHLWSQTYDRDLTDIFAVQEDVSRAVAEALSTTLGAAADPFAPRTDDPEAYDLLLRADQQMQIGGGENMLRAEQLFRQALARDPDFNAARGGLANALLGIASFYAERAPEALREADELAARLQEDVPDGWLAYDLRSFRYALAGDFVGSRRMLDLALEHAPPSARPDVEARIASLRRTTGHYAATLDQAREAVRRDPLSLSASLGLQFTLYATGRLEEAEAEYERSKDLAGDRTIIEAFAVLRAAQEEMGRDVIGARYARVLAASLVVREGAFDIWPVFDDRAAALAGLRQELARIPASNTMSPLAIAWWADYYGDTELALQALRVRLDLGTINGFGAMDPVFKHIRATPGFKDIVRDYGYLDYWRATGEWSDFCRPLGDDDFECS